MSNQDYNQTRSYLLARLNCNKDIKLKLAQFLINTSPSTEDLLNNIFSRVTEQINLILEKSGFNIIYLCLLIDFLSIELIKFEDLKRLPTNLNDLFIYLSGCIVSRYSLAVDEQDLGANCKRLDTSSILSLSNSWIYIVAKNDGTTTIHSNLSNSHSNKKCRLFRRIQKFILCCCYCK